MTTTTKKNFINELSLNTVQSLSKERNDPAWLLDLRKKAFAQFETLPWPGARDDQWRRTGLEEVNWEAFTLSPTAPSQTTGEGWVSLEDAIQKHPDAIKAAWTDAIQKAAKNKFLSLTLALGNGGACLFVPNNTQVKTPFHRTAKAGDKNSASFPLNFIFVGKNSSISLWEELNEGGEKENFLASYTSINLEENAEASFYFIEQWNTKTTHLQFQDIHQKANSKLNTISVATGGQIFRNQASIYLNGKGAENRVLGLTFGDKNQNFENWITQNHVSPHTTSNIQYRGALKGSSKSFLSGMISIIKEAQRSDAYQSAKYLLLSKNARADAIPNLEILADDVQCAHGAAVGPVDEDQKYYLGTRGVPPQKAEEIIISGFFEPVVAEIPSDAVQEKLRAYLEEKLKSHE